MTEASMPKIDASGEGGWTSGGGGGGMHGVELVRAITSVENHPCMVVLYWDVLLNQNWDYPQKITVERVMSVYVVDLILPKMMKT